MFLTAFIYGLLAASLALIFEVVAFDFKSGLNFSLSEPSFTDFLPLLLAVIIEESSRLLLVTQYARRFFVSDDISLNTVLLTGLFFGLGFTTPECLLIFWETGHGNYPFLPVLGIALVHITLSLLYILTLGKKLGLNPWTVVFLGISLHLIYNTLLAN